MTEDEALAELDQAAAAFAVTETEKKQRTGTLRNGNPSGNGRPKGVKNARTKIMYAARAAGRTEQGMYLHLIRNAFPDPVVDVKSGVETIPPGCIQSQKLILDRLLPPLKPTEQPVKFELPECSALEGTLNAITRAMADGNISVGDWRTIVSTFATVKQALEFEGLQQQVEETAKQLTELEGKRK